MDPRVNRHAQCRRIMPRYVLDDRGILTVVSETDGGLSTLERIFRTVTAVLMAASVLVSCFLFGYYGAAAEAGGFRRSAEELSESVQKYSHGTQMEKVLSGIHPLEGMEAVLSKTGSQMISSGEKLQKIFERTEMVLSDLEDRF